MSFKPQLAPCKTPTNDELRFPLLASPKIDGVRAMVRGGVVVSRTLKAIPNAHVQRLYGRPEYEGYDGELTVGPANAPNVMQTTMSGVMRREGEPDVTWHVFDLCNRPTEEPYQERYDTLRSGLLRLSSGIGLLLQSPIADLGALEAYEAACLAQGFEGAMARSPDGLYKHGRCTLREANIFKIKRFEDAEAVVVGVQERLHNTNEATTDELGRTKRSTHAAGKRPAGDLGALLVRTPEGIDFALGTGFTAAQRVALWSERLALPGRTVTYKSFTACGVKVAPRIPVFRSFRDPIDVGEP